MSTHVGTHIPTTTARMANPPRSIRSRDWSVKRSARLLSQEERRRDYDRRDPRPTLNPARATSSSSEPTCTSCGRRPAVTTVRCFRSRRPAIWLTWGFIASAPMQPDSKFAARTIQPVHQIMFANDVAVIESMTNLDLLTKTRFRIFVLPGAGAGHGFLPGPHHRV